MNYNLSNIVCIKSNKTIYQDNNYLIKIYEDNIEVSKVLNEALNQQRVLENTDLNIPKLIEVTKIADKWAIVMEYVDGINLEQYLETHKEQENDILEILISTQIKILKYRVPLLIRTKEKYAYKITNNKDLNETKRNELLEKLKAANNNNNLCHGDLSLSNIVVKTDGTIWILDWAHATIGNAEIDIARTYLTMLLNNEELATKYINKISEKLKININIIKEWLPLVAGGQLQKNTEEKSEKEFIDSIDYE